MKKENLLSRAEMKKITGGDPPTVWMCRDTNYFDISCHVTQSECNFYCSMVNGGTCQETYGQCS